MNNGFIADIFLSIYYGILTCPFSTISFHKWRIWTCMENLQFTGGVHQMWSKLNAIHQFWSGKRHVHQFIWTQHNSHSPTMVTLCTNRMLYLFSHIHIYSHRSDGIDEWVEGPSPNLVHRGIQTDAFEPWSSQTNDLQKRYLSFLSQALSIIRKG